MTPSNMDELEKALQENLKLRRELATEVAEVKGVKLANFQFRLARMFGALRYSLFGRIRKPTISAGVLELLTLEGAREQYVAHLRQLDRPALLKEIEQLRQLLSDLPPPP
jgi:hypothetical protein